MIAMACILAWFVGADYTKGYLEANPDNEKRSSWELLWDWPYLLGKEKAKNTQKLSRS